MIKTKVLWIDTETTGLNSKKNGLTELAAIMTINGKEVERVELNINAYSYNRTIEVDQQALTMTCKTEEMIKGYPNSNDQFFKFVNFLSKYGRGIQVAGYNVNFDINFIREWFKDNDVMPTTPDFSEFFSYKEIDTFSLVKQMKYLGFFETKNDKLQTLCDHFNIDLLAHNAMNDIEATMKLQKKLVALFMGINPSFDHKVTLHLNNSGSGRMDLAEDLPSQLLIRGISLMMINIVNTEEKSLQELVQIVVDDIQSMN